MANRSARLVEAFLAVKDACRRRRRLVTWTRRLAAEFPKTHATAGFRGVKDLLLGRFTSYGRECTDRAGVAELADAPG
jgi:hypothetical protein